MFALGGIDHSASHDFLGVVIARGAVADMNGQFRLSACGIRRGLHLQANGEPTGKGAFHEGDLARQVRLEVGELEPGGGGDDAGVDPHVLDLRLGLAFLAFGRTQFALTSNLGGLELSDGLLINLLGRLRQGFVERHQRHLQVAVHEHGRHAEVLGVGHETVLAGEVAGDVGGVIEPDAQQILKRVLVLVPAHAPHELASARAGTLGGGLLEARFQPGGEAVQLGLGQLCLVLRRHLAFVELVQHLMPVAGTLAFVQVGCKCINPKLALLFLWPVALYAMLLNERQNIGFVRLQRRWAFGLKGPQPSQSKAK